MKHEPIRLGRIHDGFCRCEVCKPPLVGERLPPAIRLLILIAAVVTPWVMIAALFWKD